MLTADEVAAKERMLGLWRALSTTRSTAPVTLLTTDKTLVQASTLLANGSQTLFAATDLETPLGRYPTAVLRRRDVTQIHVRLSKGELAALLLSSPRSSS